MATSQGIVVDKSTHGGDDMTEDDRDPGAPAIKKGDRNLGIRLDLETIAAVKAEAARRGLSVRKLFEEMWSAYLDRRQP